MDLSVVIVSYNVSSFLDQALKTLMDSAKGYDVEIFVVDNASSDDSVDMVRRKYPRVNLIANTENLGFARANNLALQRVTGRYVLLLNPDTVLQHDTVGTMLDFLDAHPEAGAAGCKVINPDGTLQLACRRGFPTPGVAFFKMVGLSNLFPRSRTFGAYNLTYLDPEQVSEVDAISGSFMMLRREALEKTGFLDEDFFMYGEDLDLCFRIKQAGWKIFYVPMTEIIHFKGESTKTVPSMKSIYIFYDAMQIFVQKHYRGASRFIFPRWVLTAGIYTRMGVVFLADLMKKGRFFMLDLFLLNVSLILGILLRYGLSLEDAPNYSDLQWLVIFAVYSAVYVSAFYFSGIFHRYRLSPDRALLAVFIGFLFNVLIINFIKQYNFSRLATFYSWGLNSILISGWRFIIAELTSLGVGPVRNRAVIIGLVEDAVALKTVFDINDVRTFDIIGCIETTPGAIRGREYEGIHVLGLVDELAVLLREYSVDDAIIVGSTLPYSKILGATGGLGPLRRPRFKFVPDFPSEDGDRAMPTMIEIVSGATAGTTRS